MSCLKSSIAGNLFPCDRNCSGLSRDQGTIHRREIHFQSEIEEVFRILDSYVPDPGNYRQDLWSQVGYTNGPDTWDQLYDGTKKVKAKFGNPCGLGLSQELDTNMALRAMLWSFGGSVQDAEGNVAINSKATVDAVKFMVSLY